MTAKENINAVELRRRLLEKYSAVQVLIREMVELAPEGPQAEISLAYSRAHDRVYELQQRIDEAIKTALCPAIRHRSHERRRQ